MKQANLTKRIYKCCKAVRKQMKLSYHHEDVNVSRRKSEMFKLAVFFGKQYDVNPKVIIMILNCNVKMK